MRRCWRVFSCAISIQPCQAPIPARQGRYSLAPKLEEIMRMNAIDRAWLSLDGLSVGDAFGERFFGPSHEVLQNIARRDLPVAPWIYTDDTEMALSIVEILQEHGGIDQYLLAQRFARRMQFSRNYGKGAYTILCGIREGLDWRTLTRIGFRGQGSFGNGAAMRVAPLGAFFADQPLGLVCEQARLSAEVTHAQDRKSTRLNSSHVRISYAVFCLKKKKIPCRRSSLQEAQVGMSAC